MCIYKENMKDTVIFALYISNYINAQTKIGEDWDANPEVIIEGNISITP